jgi:hypothetical protein
MLRGPVPGGIWRLMTLAAYSRVSAMVTTQVSVQGSTMSGTWRNPTTVTCLPSLAVSQVFSTFGLPTSPAFFDGQPESPVMVASMRPMSLAVQVFKQHLLLFGDRLGA